MLEEVHDCTMGWAVVGSRGNRKVCIATNDVYMIVLYIVLFPGSHCLWLLPLCHTKSKLRPGKILLVLSCAISRVTWLGGWIRAEKSNLQNVKLPLSGVYYTMGSIFSGFSPGCCINEERLSVTNLNSENNLPMFLLNAPVVIGAKWRSLNKHCYLWLYTTKACHFPSSSW